MVNYKSIKYIDNETKSKKYDNIVPYFDAMAYKMNKKHNWIYNKLKLCQFNNYNCYPEGVLPDKNDYHIFSKPIMNFSEFSRGSYTINNEKEFKKGYRPGNFWTKKFKGQHLIKELLKCLKQ